MISYVKMMAWIDINSAYNPKKSKMTGKLTLFDIRYKYIRTSRHVDNNLDYKEYF